MTLTKTLALGITSLGLLANFGCSSSSPGTGSTTVVSTNGISTCTTNTTTTECIPTLNGIVDYQGKIAVTNASLLQTIINNDPLQASESNSYIQNNTYVDILLQAESTGPSITMTILLGQLPQGALPIQVPPGFQWSNVLTGYTQFLAGSSNPSAGTIWMSPAGLSIVDYIGINSLIYPWDGTVPDMPAMAITIGGVSPSSTGGTTNPTFGTVGLINVYP